MQNYVLLIKIMWRSSGCINIYIYIYPEIGPVLEVQTLRHLGKHGIEIQTPLHLETTKFVWSNPEAQTVTSIL